MSTVGCCRRMLVLLANISLAGSVLAGETIERRGIHQGFFGTSQFTANWVSRWPATAGLHETTKLAAGVRPTGLAQGSADPFDQVSPFDFPALRSYMLMDGLAFSVGAIRGSDTLVSTGGGITSLMMVGGQELMVPDHPLTGQGVLPDNIGLGQVYRAVTVDTFTQAHLPNHHISYDPYHGNHLPLGISVLQKSYTWDYHAFKNVLLLDYTVTNIGDDRLDNAYACVAFVPHVETWAYYIPLEGRDEMVGTFRDMGVVFACDADADAIDGRFARDTSVIDGVGVSLVRCFPAPAETTYNWSLSGDNYYYEEEFAPRQRETPEEPFRSFYADRVAPYSDRDYYYQMRHPEWDYDLLEINRVGDSSSIWQPPPSEAIRLAGRGGQPRNDLALGPFDLPRGASVRGVFAVMGVDAVHTDPAIGECLQALDIDEYYRRLHLTAFREAVVDARELADVWLSLENPPTGLHVTDLTGDTLCLAWDPYVFPGVTGYRIRLSLVPASDFVALGQVRPGSKPVGGATDYRVPAEQASATITGLARGQFYFAQVAHEYDGGSGRFSYPVVVGYGNRSLIPKPVELVREVTFVEPGDTGVVLTWVPIDDGLTSYCRIYRATDSTEAANRYAPFFAVDTQLTSQIPRACGESDGLPWCYYQMQAYDSVPAGQPAYFDPRINENAWYWVAAVSRYGYESEFSPPIRVCRDRTPEKDILVILGSTGTFHDFVLKDSLLAYYSRLLAGYEFDLYDWADSNLYIRSDRFEYRVKWDDLARYRTVIIEEMPASAVLAFGVEESTRTLQHLIASGRDVLYFGVPAGQAGFNLNTDHNTLVYPEGTFETRFFDCDSLAIRTWRGAYNVLNVPDTLAGFSGAMPARDSLPYLRADRGACRTSMAFNRLFAQGVCLPLTPAFYCGDEAEILYTYESAFPESSELQGLPCGIRRRRPGANVYAFSFHLWGMEQDDARALVDYAFIHREPDTGFIPHYLPRTIQLYQNYPNPFNPSTTIPFDLARQSHVRLEVFNILGQVVNTLVDGERVAGSYEVNWGGRDSRGNQVASGVYFYRLHTGAEARTRKMLLVK